MKFTFIGAGSFGFTRKLITDMLTFPALQDAEYCLMDIDPVKLGYIKQAVEKIVAQGNYPAKVTSTLNRAEALQGADGVTITILSGGPSVFRTDIEIPKKYGVDTCVGDTRSVSGIFRFLRTAPAMLEICQDIKKYCPDALVLNYTNPMAMLCKFAKDTTGINITGLCHSVQGTAAMLAAWIGAPMEEITYTCAGINHQAFFIDYKWNNKDAYPLIREAVQREDIYKQEIVRNEMFLHLDYYVTESSGHNSEYVQWFRKRPDLIEKYCTHGTGWNPGEYAYILRCYFEQEDKWEQNIKEYLAQEKLDLSRGYEYAAHIFNAVIGDGTPYEFNGNVPNTHLITNLPENCCVEVPVLATKHKLQGIHVGDMPEQLAILLNTSARIEDMVVRGCIEGDKRKIFQAVLFDPLTSAVCSMQEIKDMVEEMFIAGKDYLGYFK